MPTNPTVLVVDDDPGFRKTLSDILDMKGYVPVALNKGKAALDCLETERPAVALIDLKLDDISGLTLLKQIKKRHLGIECILLTGHASQASAIEAVNLGAYGYLQKPYDIEQLLVMIQRAIERQQAEGALRASEERFRQVVVSISDHIYMTELTAEGEYRNPYHSPDIQTLTGYPPEKFVDNWHFWMSDVIYPEDRELAKAQAARLAQGHSSEVEYRLVRADGQVIWVRDSARVQSQTEPMIIYGVVSDITERRQLEEQLRQSQKMEAVGQLAGGVAHDFNNILTVIIGNCDLALDRLNVDNPLYKDIKQIQKAGERAISLTRQLLTFSRKQVLQLRVLDLNTVVNDMDTMLRRLIGEDVDLVTILDPMAKPIRSDPSHLEQILLNLVLNARDAMPQGGELTVEIANVYLDERYARRHVGVKPGAYTMLAVTDDGEGMDEATQSHIFEPFFTTKGPSKGTGLGLATVYGIVSQSGGHIWVHSEAGQGTTFKVYLPQVDEEIEESKDSWNVVKPQQMSETVLLVEDEEMVRELAQRILLNGGYMVLVASDGNQALQLSEKYSHNIDLLLTDIVMPGGISGRQLAERMLVRYPDIKVLYMSGYTDDAIIHHGAVDNGMGFLQKPFTSNVLLNKVQQILNSTASTVGRT